jgi:hypothetical protein
MIFIYNILIGLWLIGLYEYHYILNNVTIGDKIGLSIGLVNFIYGLLAITRPKC